jgi:hypothetical protein
MEPRAEILRRRAALYRECLSRGVDSELAGLYLRKIAAAAAELARIEAATQPAPPVSCP